MCEGLALLVGQDERLEKLGAHSRVEAIVRAGRLGLVEIAAIAIAFDLVESVLGPIVLATA